MAVRGHRGTRTMTRTAPWDEPITSDPRRGAVAGLYSAPARGPASARPPSRPGAAGRTGRSAVRTIVRGKNLEVPDRVREYAERKFGRLERLLDDRSDAVLELSNEAHRSAVGRAHRRGHPGHRRAHPEQPRGGGLLPGGGGRVLDKVERQAKDHKERPRVRARPERRRRSCGRSPTARRSRPASGTSSRRSGSPSSPCSRRTPSPRWTTWGTRSSCSSTPRPRRSRSSTGATTATTASSSRSSGASTPPGLKPPRSPAGRTAATGFRQRRPQVAAAYTAVVAVTSPSSTR